MAEIIFLIIIFVPLLLVLWFANLADKETRGIATDIRFSGLSVADPVLDFASCGRHDERGGKQVVQLLCPMALQMNPAATMPCSPESFDQIGLALIIPAIFGLIVLLPFVRRIFARLSKSIPSVWFMLSLFPLPC